MYLIFNALFPVFIIMALGFVAENYRLLGKNSSKVLTGYVYYFALPPLLFVAMASEPISKSINLSFVAAFAISTIILYLIGFGVSVFFKPKSLQCASIRALTISSPNTAYMGIPLLLGLFGSKAILPVALSTIILIFILAVSIFIIEITNQKEHKKKLSIYSATSIIFRNPLVISPILGILFALFGGKLPVFLSSFCHQIGMTAGPCALFAIGQTLVGSAFFTKKIEFSLVAFLRLIIHPLLMLLFIFIFHLSMLWAAAGFILSAMPTAAAVFIVAQKYQIYEKRVSSLILETTLSSIITLPIVVTVAFHIWPQVF